MSKRRRKVTQSVVKMAGWPTFKQNYQGRLEQGCWAEKLFITGRQNIENTERTAKQMSQHNCL